MEYRTYKVSAAHREPLVRFMTDALRASGCRLLFVSPADLAPFRITFEAPSGERMGIIVYAFLANQRLTRNRPADEHRFQVKYGSRDGRLHRLWQDPYGLYTTLFLGINPEIGFFVGADPVLHSPTRLFISIELKNRHVDQILRDGWASWERDRRAGEHTPVEVLVGGTADHFLRYVRFEREAVGEDQGHRQLLAERLDQRPGHVPAGGPTVVPPHGRTLHELAREFELSEKEVLDLIESAPRLKMAVRGWVAEEHLYRELQSVPDVTECRRMEEEGGADIALRFRGLPVRVECKNVLRLTTSAGIPRVDFQRTRASKADPCSRYYRPADFDVVAACLHAVTEKWEFRYINPERLDPHRSCEGKLSNNVRIDERWVVDPQPVLAAAVA